MLRMFLTSYCIVNASRQHLLTYTNHLTLHYPTLNYTTLTLPYPTLNYYPYRLDRTLLHLLFLKLKKLLLRYTIFSIAFCSAYLLGTERLLWLD